MSCLILVSGAELRSPVRAVGMLNPQQAARLNSHLRAGPSELRGLQPAMSDFLLKHWPSTSPLLWTAEHGISPPSYPASPVPAPLCMDSQPALMCRCTCIHTTKDKKEGASGVAWAVKAFAAESVTCP